MGGLFRSSPTPSYTPPAVQTIDPDAEMRKQREEAIARNRRGRAGLVATSDRGVLSQVSANGKSLLGE